MFVALVILAWSAAISLYLWFRGPANLRKGSMPGDIRHGLTVKALQSMGEPDMIVIGSGPGGLTVAALMAKLGKKVLVLEQHDVAGVCLCVSGCVCGRVCMRVRARTCVRARVQRICYSSNSASVRTSVSQCTTLCLCPPLRRVGSDYGCQADRQGGLGSLLERHTTRRRADVLVCERVRMGVWVRACGCACACLMRVRACARRVSACRCLCLCPYACIHRCGVRRERDPIRYAHTHAHA